MKKYNYVYKTTNISNGKLYIGSHSSNKKSDNYFGSGLLITRAIKKHGKEKFQKEILEYLPKIIDARKLEEKYIEKYNTLIPNGYNISLQPWIWICTAIKVLLVVVKKDSKILHLKKQKEK